MKFSEMKYTRPDIDALRAALAGVEERIRTARSAGEQIEALAAAMGYEAKVYITGRRKVERLTFPFRKWQ